MIQVYRNDRLPQALTPPLYRIDVQDGEYLKTEMQTTDQYVPTVQLGMRKKSVITAAQAYDALDAGQQTALLAEINSVMVEDGGTPWATLADFFASLPAGRALYVEQAFFA